MHVLVTGAAGMIGRKLVAALAERGHVGGTPVSTLTLIDVVAPTLPADVPGAALAADLSDPAAAGPLMETRPDVVVHLAAVVSGEAERDLARGYAVNLDGTAALLRAAAAEGHRPRVVQASSIAVFGTPLPDMIPDDHPPRPLTSYGTQKAMAEMLLDDLVRRGAIDGASLRLPTICVRPGAPNAAASGFFSGIVREPLAGEEAVLPVPDDTRHWFASPRAAVGFLLRAMEADLDALGHARALSLPGVSCTVAEQIAALERIAPGASARIRREPDPRVMAIVETWPEAFEATRARAMGFEADPDFDAILAAHVEDELGGEVPVSG